MLQEPIVIRCNEFKNKIAKLIRPGMRVVLTHDHSHSQTSEPKTIAGYITKLPWDCVIRLRSEQRDLSSADRESTNRQTAQNTKSYRHS